MTICSLGYVLIEATELEPWRHFACQVLGLMEVTPPQNAGSNKPSTDSLQLKMDAYPYRFNIVKGEQDRFLLPGWELDSAASFNALVQKLKDVGLSCEIGSEHEAQSRHVRQFAKAVDPTGTGFEFFYGMRLDYEPLISAVGVKGFVTGQNGDMGLGHIAISTPDIATSHQFYTHVLGFAQTDYMHFRFSDNADDAGQGLHFLHCNNPRHHSLALFEDSTMPSGSMIHLMIEVLDLDHLGLMMDRVKQHNIPIVNSLGKHTNDEMISIYVESPAGFAIEYGFGGLQVDWQHYRVTESAKASLWGHNWNYK
jgi:3,4-dihydroxy-9,10-secoandrosta-1,3,5(10)-triene-9,17-dione 4,5-dioxygenase